MPGQTPIETPAKYAPVAAIGFADETGNFVLASADRPMPVGSAPRPESPAALFGMVTLDSLAGPFEPVPGRPVVLQLHGDWTGTVQLQRSVDGGTTRVPVTIGGQAWARFTANACEPVWAEEEAGAQLYLDCRIASGSLSYRVSQ